MPGRPESEAVGREESGLRASGAVPAGGPPGERPPVRRVDLDWRSVVVAMAAFVGVVVATGLVRSAPRTLTALTVGTLLALALNPVVAVVQRRLVVRRTVAVALVLSALAVLLALVVALAVPPAVRQARELRTELPDVVRQLEELPVVGDDLRKGDVPDKVRRWVEELPDRLEGDTTPIEEAGRVVVDSLLIGFVTLLVAVTLLLDGERVLAALRRLVPDRHQGRAHRMADLAYQVVGRYVAGSLLVAGTAGLAVLVAGLLLGVPLAPLLAVWVAVFDLVPQIGGAVGGIPFVLLGFSQGALTGVACAVFFVLYTQFENHVLSPLVVGQAVKLSPPATMTAALIGVSAAGVVGAMVAVPLAGAAKAVYLELRPA
jgi:putative heme transporter